ncbi:MAG: efflux RND transporter periplasmic adaptor subunit [Planctomycetia bacterium]|nr:efflux RND transporter periplasmic adaptor subunit [Planctomycetia bacterium]
MLSKYGMPLFATGLLVFAISHVLGMQKTPPKLDPSVPPARSPYGSTVAAAGLVEPTTENINIGAAVPGVVYALQVKVGQKVQQGQPLFTVDNRHLEAQKKARESELLSAQAQLDKLMSMPRPEEIPVKQAKLREAQANLSDQELLWKRSKGLYETAGRSGAITEEEYIRRRQAYEMAQQQELAAQADLKLLLAGAWEADKAVARATIAQAQAQLDMVKTEIERTIVRASVSGEVLQVNVRPGEYVSNVPGQGQSYVVIGNVDQLHVRVDIDEHDIPRFKSGAIARANPRGDANQFHQLRFVRIEPFVVPKRSLTGNTTERIDTRVLQVIYAVQPASQDSPRLYVGQQVDVFIDIGDKAEVSQAQSR